MINEWLQIAVLAWCSVLFAVGGTKGKYWRRFVLPAGLLVVALLSGVIWWKAVAMAVSLIVALSLGYGERTVYWLKALVFASYGASFLWIGFTWWMLISPAVLMLLFMASNWKPLASTVFWKAWEFLAGAMIALCFIGSLIGRW